MPTGEFSELLPVSDFVDDTMGAIRLCLVVSGFCLPLQPQVNRVATQLKQLSRNASLHAI